MTLLFASTLALSAPSAHAVDLVVHASMVVKALKAQLFKDRGRYYLHRPGRCNDPYLENPTVSFKQGRVYVGAHLARQIGALIAGVCQSATEPSAIVPSARPVVRLQEAALEDVRLEGADKPNDAIPGHAFVRSLSGGIAPAMILCHFADSVGAAVHSVRDSSLSIRRNLSCATGS